MSLQRAQPLVFVCARAKMRFVVRVTSTSLAKGEPEFEGRLYRARDKPGEYELAYTSAELRKLNVVGGPICIEHDYKLGRVGRIKASRYSHPWLYITGVIDTKDPKVREEVRAGLRSGRLGELSIGFHASLGDDGVFRDKVFDEASLVARGFHEGTKIVAVCASAADAGRNRGPQVTVLRSDRDIFGLLRHMNNCAASQPAAAAAAAAGAASASAATTTTLARCGARSSAVGGTIGDTAVPSACSTWSVLASVPRDYMNGGRETHTPARDDLRIFVRATATTDDKNNTADMLSAESAAGSAAAAAAAAAADAASAGDAQLKPAGGNEAAPLAAEPMDVGGEGGEYAVASHASDNDDDDGTGGEGDGFNVDTSRMTAQQVANHYQAILEKTQQSATEKLAAERKAKAELERRTAEL